MNKGVVLLAAGKDSALASEKSFANAELTRALESAGEGEHGVEYHRDIRTLLPLLDISKTLLSQVESDKLFSALLKIIWKETDAESVSLLLREGRELFSVAALGLPQVPSPQRTGKGVVGWVAKTGQPLLLNQGSQLEPGLSSVLCLPLIATGKVLGVLWCSKTVPREPFTYADLEFLSLLCGQAATALGNAGLFEALRKEQRRANHLLRQNILAQEQERRRISLEIHDGVAPWLAAASYRLQALDRLLETGQCSPARAELVEVGKFLKSSLKELRRVITALLPPALEVMGLVASLRQLLEDTSKETGISGSFSLEGEAKPLPHLTEISVYRIIQEALSNVMKHSKAERVSLCLRFLSRELEVEICDDGRGFNLERALESARARKSLGLRSMRERAESLGGSWRVDTAEGAGTAITLSLPLGT